MPLIPRCPYCRSPAVVYARLSEHLLSDLYRCTGCRVEFPFDPYAGPRRRDGRSVGLEGAYDQSSASIGSGAVSTLPPPWRMGIHADGSTGRRIAPVALRVGCALGEPVGTEPDPRRVALVRTPFGVVAQHGTE